MNNNKVKKLYSKRALLYERLYVDFLGWGRLLEDFFKESNYLLPDMKVLDAGCGTGIITRSLSKFAKGRKDNDRIEFHAFDLTSSMLDVFQARMKDEAQVHITLRQADILSLTSLPEDWNEYDLIVTSAVLEYIPKTKMNIALGNLERLLKDDGLLLLFITKQNVLTTLTGKLWWGTNLFKEDEIKRNLKEVGFRNIKFKNLPPIWSNNIMVVEARK